jgi:hypothetical protein
MKLEIKCAILVPGVEKPVEAPTEEFRPESPGCLGETLLKNIPESPQAAEARRAASHLAGLAPEWTVDFLGSI